MRARYTTGKGIPKWRVMAPSALVVIGSCLVGFPFFYQVHWGVILAGGVLFFAGTAGFYTLPVVYRPEGFAVPLNPFLPCLGTLANIFLIGEPTAAAAACMAAGNLQQANHHTLSSACKRTLYSYVCSMCLTSSRAACSCC